MSISYKQKDGTTDTIPLTHVVKCSCPECGKEIDYVDATITSSEDYTVGLEDGEPEWEHDHNRDGNDEHIVVNCPTCGKIIFQGEGQDVRAQVEDFLKGVQDEKNV